MARIIFTPASDGTHVHLTGEAGFLPKPVRLIASRQPFNADFRPDLKPQAWELPTPAARALWKQLEREGHALTWADPSTATEQRHGGPLECPADGCGAPRTRHGAHCPWCGTAEPPIPSPPPLTSASGEFAPRCDRCGAVRTFGDYCTCGGRIVRDLGGGSADAT